MPEHTPGPWDAHDGPEVMAGDWEQHVATCWNNDKVTPDEALANARLIARAPLLLETLRELVDAAGDCVSDPDGLFPGGHNWPPYQRLLTACVAATRAIVAAEGHADGPAQGG
jgi:hypothetical protein